jgi:hypothetical protein
MQKYIYVLLTKTPTKFGSLIRKIAKQQYNHASIALDDKFNHVYAFARKKHNTPLVAGLVRESLDRFTLKTEEPVPTVIFRIPVKSEQYAFISNLINNMLDNTDYVYNLFSVLSQPVFKGFATKHAFSCIEFVAYILQYLGYLKNKKACKYKPDDLLIELDEYVYNLTDVRNIIHYNPSKTIYFDPMSFKAVPETCLALGRVIKHSFHLYPNIQNLHTFHIE